MKVFSLVLIWTIVSIILNLSGVGAFATWDITAWPWHWSCCCILWLYLCFVAIVNRDDFRVITERSPWRHCAEIPKPTFATHREFSRWLAEGRGEWKRASMNMVYTSISYEESMANDFVDFALVRKWDDTKWHNPTREYLGLED